MAQITQEIVTLKFTKIIADGGSPQFASSTEIKTSLSGIIEGLFGADTIVDVASIANVTIIGNSVAITNVAGTGDIATLSFDTQSDAPFLPGQNILVTNVTPAGYNGTAMVVTCSNSAVTFTSTATGDVAFVAGVGTVTEVA